MGSIAFDFFNTLINLKKLSNLIMVKRIVLGTPNVSPPVKTSEITNEKFVTDLPLGIRLTGGEKLRTEGKTGQGVRVAVIDSGVDKDHPEFNGRVGIKTNVVQSRYTFVRRECEPWQALFT